MKKMKKFIALILSVIMLLSVTPVAFAQEAAEETTTAAVETDDTLSAAGDLFGGFFVKIGEMLQIIFDFLANLFSGTGDNSLENM